MENKISADNIKYDAYYIENKPGENFILPKDCNGAIGITLDDKLNGVKHAGIKAINQISSKLQDIDIKDNYQEMNITHMMHAFVVTNQMDTTLKVCHTASRGLHAGEIKMGDKHWTSMILFIPRDQNISDQIVLTAEQELKTDEKGQTADYGYKAGMISFFTKKRFSENNHQIIAAELADIIKSRSIKDIAGNPKACICSQLALRILRTGTLMEAIPAEDMRKYELIDGYNLRKELIIQMLKKDSALNRAFSASELFNVKANIDTLPYELYRALKKESELH